MRDTKESISPSVLKLLRDRFDLTLVELGRESEINISTLSLFENGKGNLSPEAAHRLEAALIQALRKIEEKERKEAERKRKDVLKESKALRLSMPELSANLVNYAVGVRLSKEEMEDLKVKGRP